MCAKASAAQAKKYQLLPNPILNPTVAKLLLDRSWSMPHLPFNISVQ